MNRKDKIDAIYKEIANKELSFGCRLKANIQTENIGDTNATVKYYGEIKSELPGGHMVKVMYGNSQFAILSCYTKTIGHPILIGDVLDWIVVNKLGGAEYQWTCDKWIKLREPIEEQSDECIDYIDNLLKGT